MDIYRFKCKNCGSTVYKKVDENTYKCEYCNYTEIVKGDKKEKTNVDSKINSVISDINDSEQLKQIIYLALLIPFGALGIHKFMKGKIFLGLLYLLTGGLLYIGVICDFISGVKQLINNAKKNDEIVIKKQFKEE